MSKPAVRPLIAFSILQLEEAFEKARTCEDKRKIKEIAKELQCRSVPKAKKLLRTVSDHIDSAGKAKQSRKKPTDRGASRAPALAAISTSTVARDSAVPMRRESIAASISGAVANEPSQQVKQGASPLALSTRKLSSSGSSRPPLRHGHPALTPVRAALGPQQVERLLDSWIALEVLTPLGAYKYPTDLVVDGKTSIAEFDGLPNLPWLRGEISDHRCRLFYHVVIGAISLDTATARLRRASNGPVVHEGAADKRAIENGNTAGFAPIATLTLDRDGRPVESGAIAISGFAWGLPLALKQDLNGLSGWPRAKLSLVGDAELLVRQADDSGRPIPVTADLVQALFKHLVERMGLADELVVEPQFALRVQQSLLAEAPPASPLLGASLLTDLATAKQQVGAGNLPGNLASYLGLKAPSHAVDLRGDHAALADAVAPAKMPLGKWPEEGGQPSALLRQAVVNLALDGDEQTGLLPVRHPAGKGGTLPLRDIVAAVVVERAQAISELFSPSEAFSHVGKVRSGNGFADYHALKDTLKGFEILVASESPEAMDNVGADLTALTTHFSGREDLRYFKTISDALSHGLSRENHEKGIRRQQTRGQETSHQENRAQETWGLVAAVLNSPSDRQRFKQRGWDDKDLGLKTYLLEISGGPQFIEVVDQKTGLTTEQRKPVVVSAEKPPAGEQLRWRWQNAQRDFRAKAKEVRENIDILERGRQALGEAPDTETETLLETQFALSEKDSEEAHLLLFRLSEETEAIRQSLLQVDLELQDHAVGKPSLFRRLIGSEQQQQWSSTQDRLARDKALLLDKLKRLEEQLSSSKTKFDEAAAVVASLGQVAAKLSSKREAAAQAIDAAIGVSGLAFVDAAFFDRPEAEFLGDMPWLNGAIDWQREELFAAAMALHRAFVDAAAKPVCDNLDLLFRCFSGKAAWSERLRPIMPDLWATFFCVVPVVATTFASIDEMLGYLGEEALGWLLIDQAGQAPPQQAIGALLRTKRAVICGDSRQIAEVPPLYAELAEGIAEKFGVDGKRFMAPYASVQTLAEAASTFAPTLSFEATSERSRAPQPAKVRSASA